MAEAPLHWLCIRQNQGGAFNMGSCGTQAKRNAFGARPLEEKTKMAKDNKKLVQAITSQEDNFAQWYTDICVKA